MIMSYTADDEFSQTPQANAAPQRQQQPMYEARDM